MRSRYATVWISSWLRGAWFWSVSRASRAGCRLADAIFRSALLGARSAFLVLVASLRLLTVFLLWVAKLLCASWDFLHCLAVEVFGAKRRRARKIKHVFVLMMENRSFDHMLGFAGLEGTDAITGEPTRADDLVGKQCSNVHPTDASNAAPAKSGADFQFFAPYPCPGHEFKDTLMQLCGKNAVYPDPATGGYPAMDHSGFVASYHAKGAPEPSRIMDCYSAEQVPVLTTLAREFAVCDRWFSSMPGPTWPNRFFIHAASSAGLDDTPSPLEIVTGTLLEGYHFQKGTIFDRLDDRCLDWLVFMGDHLPQVFAISGMSAARLSGHFLEFQYFDQIVNAPDLPAAYIFIEPNYGNVLPTSPGNFKGGNSQHPLDDITAGEKLIKEVYEKIRNSPHWNDSVLLITYDEHGGFFDHVTPPATVSPGDKVTDPENNHHRFDFTQLGVRVPAVVVSPLIPRGTIDHTVYDHASVPATLEKMFNLRPMTNRDRMANTFTHLFSLATPRTDAPLTLPDPPDSNAAGEEAAALRAAGSAIDEDAEEAAPVDATLRGFLNSSFVLDYKLAPAPTRGAVARNFLKVRNRGDALRYMREVGLRTQNRQRKWKRRKLKLDSQAAATVEHVGDARNPDNPQTGGRV
ncbi:MAG TPA: alkaline phosphatase family protein [Candidatus Acidoferrales bacterium]|nr:alkaline phosphatase family protein [Candidatus Acidoferrales bacterium]